MIDIAKYGFFIFDCDGVILDSNNLKSRAFSQALFEESPELVSKFVEYHKRNGGISRYEKFRYYFKVMKNQVDSEKDIENALDRFARIVSKDLLKCNYISGAIEFIDMLFKENRRLFVVSGSDEQELIAILRKREILYYFDNIYGSPNNKIENTRKVIDSIT